jgi:hypothetical protein
MTQITMTEAEWEDKFTLVPNHIQGYDAQLFETYGAELEFVRSQPDQNIWTQVDGDGGGLYIISGMHFVNRIGYYITKEAFNPEDSIEVCIQEGCDGDTHNWDEDGYCFGCGTEKSEPENEE